MKAQGQEDRAVAVTEPKQRLTVLRELPTQVQAAAVPVELGTAHMMAAMVAMAALVLLSFVTSFNRRI